MLTLLILLVLAGIAVLAATYKYWLPHWKKVGAGLVVMLLMGGATLLFPTPTAEVWHTVTFGGSATVQLGPPTSLTAIEHNLTCLNVSFSGVSNSSYRTIVERNSSAVTVWARGAGTEIYNATGSASNYILDYPLSTGVTYYYQAWCQNTTSDNWSATNASANGHPAYDTSPPSPSPLTWIAEPTAVSTSEISMECTDATDVSEPIYYYFNETSGHTGGSSSGAQNEVMTYTDNLLGENMDYTYFCRARDSNTTPNWGAVSTPSVTTYTWAEPPENTQISATTYGATWINISVAMCANPTGGATDCYIDCDIFNDATYDQTTWTTDGDDRWYYNFTGLAASTQYGFKAKYRNGDSVETNLNPAWQYITTLASGVFSWQTSLFGGSATVGEGWVNSAPVTTIWEPKDQATGVALTPTLKINVSDPDISNQTINVTWQYHDGAVWYTFEYNETSSNATGLQQTLSNATANSTLYEWRVIVHDNHATPAYDNSTQSFTTTAGGVFTWHSSSFGGSATVSAISWGSWSVWWVMESKPASTSTLDTDGVDYLVWIGANVSAFHVAENITDAGVTWSAGEYMALWNNDTWCATRALWNWSIGTNPGANNWTVHTFDIIRTYITDDIGEVDVNVTSNPNIDFDAARNVSCTNTGSGTSGNRGYNFVAFTPGSSDLETISETNLGQATGEWVGLWGNSWDFWIANITPDSYNKNVAQYSVLQIKVTATRYLNMS